MSNINLFRNAKSFIGMFFSFKIQRNEVVQKNKPSVFSVSWRSLVFFQQPVGYVSLFYSLQILQ